MRATKRLLVELVVLVNVDRTPGVALEARVEQSRRILQRGSFEERELHDALVRLAGADPAVVRPDRNTRVGGLAPLPLLDDVGIGLLDQAAKPGERLASPVAQLLDLRVDQVSRSLGLLRGILRHRRAPPLIFSSSASTRAKPCFAPSSTPYCIVVSRCSVVSKRIVCVSFVCSPRSSNSSVWRWFWNVCTRRSGGSTSRNSPSTTPKAVRNR